MKIFISLIFILSAMQISTCGFYQPPRPTVLTQKICMLNNSFLSKQKVHNVQLNTTWNYNKDLDFRNAKLNFIELKDLINNTINLSKEKKTLISNTTINLTSAFCENHVSVAHSTRPKPELVIQITEWFLSIIKEDIDVLKFAVAKNLAHLIYDDFNEQNSDGQLFSIYGRYNFSETETRALLFALSVTQNMAAAQRYFKLEHNLPVNVASKFTNDEFYFSYDLACPGFLEEKFKYREKWLKQVEKNQVSLNVETGVLSNYNAMLEDSEKESKATISFLSGKELDIVFEFDGIQQLKTTPPRESANSLTFYFEDIESTELCENNLRLMMEMEMNRLK